MPSAVGTLMARTPADFAPPRRAAADAHGRETAAEASGRAAGGFLPDLAAMLPPGSLRALLETGRAQIDGEIATLVRAAAAGREPEAQRCAHRLAGSAGVLGLGRLVAAARAAEAAATSGDRTSLGSAVDEARSAADEVLAELGRWLGGSGEPR